MQEELKDSVMKWLTFSLLMVIVVGGLVVLYPHYQRNQELKLRKAEIERQIECKQKDIARLQDYQRRFERDRDFIEKIARENHRVFPGELVFVFD